MCNTAITLGYAQPVTCTSPVGGFSDRSIYLMNATEISGATASSTLGEVTDLTMAATKTAFKLEVEKDSFKFKEELQEDKTYTQTVEFMLKSDSTLERNFVSSLRGARLCIIGRDRNDKFPMVGFQYNSNTGTPASSTIEAVGIDLTNQVGNWSVEEFGRTVILTGVGFKEPAPYFFETSITATVTNLEDYLTA